MSATFSLRRTINFKKSIDEFDEKGVESTGEKEVVNYI